MKGALRARGCPTLWSRSHRIRSTAQCHVAAAPPTCTQLKVETCVKPDGVDAWDPAVHCKDRSEHAKLSDSDSWEASGRRTRHRHETNIGSDALVLPRYDGFRTVSYFQPEMVGAIQDSWKVS